MKKTVSFLKNSIFTENCAFVYLLGLCPLLAVTTSVIAGAFLGISALMVLLLTSVCVSLVAGYIPDRAKVISYMMIAACVVTLIELLLNAFFPSVYESLGIYLPLFIVSGLCFDRIERAEKEKPLTAMMGGISAGVGYLAVCIIFSLIREVLGKGSVCGLRIFSEEYSVRLITTPAGALILFGFLLAIFRKILPMIEKEEVQK